MKKILLSLVFVLTAMAVSAQTAARAEVSVFPNPATEFIQVRDLSASASVISVYNLVGKRLRQFDFTEGQQYMVSDLPKGMYLVQVVDRSGNVITTQKVNKR